MCKFTLYFGCKCPLVSLVIFWSSSGPPTTAYHCLDMLFCSYHTWGFCMNFSFSLVRLCSFHCRRRFVITTETHVASYNQWAPMGRGGGIGRDTLSGRNIAASRQFDAPSITRRRRRCSRWRRAAQCASGSSQSTRRKTVALALRTQPGERWGFTAAINSAAQRLFVLQQPTGFVAEFQFGKQKRSGLQEDKATAWAAEPIRPSLVRWKREEGNSAWRPHFLEVFLPSLQWGKCL